PVFGKRKNNEAVGINGIDQRERRFFLSQDVPKVRVCGKGRSLIKDRIGHLATCWVRKLVKAIWKVQTDFGIADLIHQRKPKSRVGQKRCKLNQREVVIGKDVQGISKQLFSLRSKILKVSMASDDT